MKKLNALETAIERKTTELISKKKKIEKNNDLINKKKILIELENQKRPLQNSKTAIGTTTLLISILLLLPLVLLQTFWWDEIENSKGIDDDNDGLVDEDGSGIYLDQETYECVESKSDDLNYDDDDGDGKSDEDPGCHIIESKIEDTIASAVLSIAASSCCIFPIIWFIIGDNFLNIHEITSDDWAIVPLWVRARKVAKNERKIREIKQDINNKETELGIRSLQTQIQFLNRDASTARVNRRIITKHLEDEKKILSSKHQIEETLSSIIELDKELNKHLPMDIIVSDVQKLSEGQMNEYIDALLSRELK